jgi:hypothetical protein
MMRGRLVLRPSRRRLALAVGSMVTAWSTLFVPFVGAAAIVVTYKDTFMAISYSGSDGNAAWAGPWTEGDESDGPSNGASQVATDSHCASGKCLLLGAEDPDQVAVTRSFDSIGATSVVLTFNYVRHVSSSGPGSGGAGIVRLLASEDGASWSLLDTFPLNVDDPSTLSASYDLTTFAASTSAIKFELQGAVDDSFIAIDDVMITVTDGGGAATTTTTPPASTTSTTGPPPTTTTPTTTTRPTTTTSQPQVTTTHAAAPTPPPSLDNPPTSTTTGDVTSIVTTTTTPETTTTTIDNVFLVHSTTEPPSTLTEEEAEAAKEDLVVEMPGTALYQSELGYQPDSSYQLDPREGLAASFSSAVETLKGNLLNSIVLGLTISILLLLGIDKREERVSDRPAIA